MSHPLVVGATNVQDGSLREVTFRTMAAENREPEAAGEREMTFGQAFARIEATERALLRIWLGLRSIEVVIDEADPVVVADNVDVPLETLAAGYEQLMKAILVLGHLEHDDRWLSGRELKDYRHDIVELLDAVVSLSRRTGYADDRPAVREDMDFLEYDSMLRLLADSMNGVTDTSRYDALNEFVGGGERRRPAGAVVNAIEGALLDRNPQVKTLRSSTLDEALNGAYRHDVITACQRWARALCRTYTLGLCGPRGRQLKGTVSIFLNLRDHELGKVPPWR